MPLSKFESMHWVFALDVEQELLTASFHTYNKGQEVPNLCQIKVQNVRGH